MDLNNKSILIIGSGHLNDIDLKVFKPCKLVTFLDIDIENTKKGFKRQAVSLCHECIQIDLSALSHTPFMTSFSNSTDDEKINLLNKYKTFNKPFELNSFDIIIVLPIYTQLLLPQLMPYISSNNILSEVMSFMAYRIQILNQEIMSHLNESGHILVFSDLLEYQTDSEEGKYLTAHQKQEFILEDHVMSYMNQYGHGLGSFGLANICDQAKLVKETYIYWPFNKDKLLIVAGRIAKKQSV